MGAGGAFWSAFEDLCKPFPPAGLNGRVLVIDLTSWLVTFDRASHHRDSAWPRMLADRVSFLSKDLGASLVFVVDGECHPLKRKKTSLRLRVMTSRAKSILERDGFKVFEATCDGERLCSLIQVRAPSDRAVSVVSPDSDCLGFGATSIFRVFKTSRGFCEIIEVNPGNYSPGDFSIMLIISGCDFYPGFHRIGPKKAREFIDKCHNHGRLNEVNDFAKYIAAPDEAGVMKEQYEKFADSLVTPIEKISEALEVFLTK